MIDWGMHGFLGLFYVAFLLPVAAVLWLLVIYLRRSSMSNKSRAVIFTIISMVTACPVIVPAGTISAAFIPFGVALAFSRNIGDLLWFGKLWQINLAGLFVAMIVSALIARWLFSNRRFQGDAVTSPRA